MTKSDLYRYWVVVLCPTLCNPMDCSTPVFSVLRYSPELARFMSIESLMLSNHLILCHSLLLLPSVFPSFQGLFQWVSSSHQEPKVLALQLQHQSFQWIFRVDFLQDWLVWSPCCPWDSRVFYIAPQFGRINSSVLSLLYSPIFTSIHTTGKTVTLTIWTLVGKVWCLCFLTGCLGLSVLSFQGATVF